MSVPICFLPFLLFFSFFSLIFAHVPLIFLRHGRGLHTALAEHHAAGIRCCVASRRGLEWESQRLAEHYVRHPLCPSWLATAQTRRSWRAVLLTQRVVEHRDCYPNWKLCIDFHQQQMQPGLVSRDGWSVIDDSRSFLFDNDSSFPPSGWRVRRQHAEEYSDWLFFGHGHEYTEALSDFTAISGKVPIMPWRA